MSKNKPGPLAQMLASRKEQKATPSKYELTAPRFELPTAAEDQSRHDACAWQVFEIISEFPDAEAVAILSLASTLSLNRMIQQREKDRPKYVEK